METNEVKVVAKFWKHSLLFLSSSLGVWLLKVTLQPRIWSLSNFVLKFEGETQTCYFFHGKYAMSLTSP